MSSYNIDNTFLRELPFRDGTFFLQPGRVDIQNKLEDHLFGSSYLGYHRGLTQPVVIRVYPPEFKQQAGEYQRFLDDARRVARVRHPSIAAVFDVGEYRNHAYLVMEYVSGVPLIERIHALALPEYEAVSLLLPVAEGLAELWMKGFVHRSVSPHYIALPSDGPPKLEVKTILPHRPIDSAHKRHLTPIMAPYWSPEELTGSGRLDGRSDMWSFAVVFYHAVTGRIPFHGDTLEKVMQSILNDAPIDPCKINASLSSATRDLMEKLLAKNPNDRFPTAEAFLLALRGLQSQIARSIKEVKTQILPSLPPVAQARTGRTEQLGQQLAETLILHGDGKKFGEGDIIGSCRLVRQIGDGATGKVYRGRHRVLDIDMAVKLLDQELAEKEPVFRELFLREARTAARIRHPNVLSIFEAGTQNGQEYIVMEYAPGGTLKTRMEAQGGKVSPEEAARVMLGVARGLAAAESVGVVHRNIKPDNIMFGTGDEVKLADLGLAKRVLPRSGGVPTESLLQDQITQRHGASPMSGAPAYMAPELATSPEDADIRADLYSLGITAYNALLGRLPFKASNAMEILRMHQEVVPIAPHNADARVPEEISAIVMKLLAKKPSERPQHAKDLVEALEMLRWKTIREKV